MTANAIITQIDRVEPIPGADKIKQAFALGYSLVVGLDTKTGDRGILFPGGDLALNKQYATENNLLKSQGGYLDDDKRRISTMKLRGIKSEGLFMKLSSLNYLGIDTSKLQDGYEFTHLYKRKNLFWKENFEICYRYLTPKAREYLERQKRKGNKRFTRTEKRGETMLFRKMQDVSQLRHVIGQIPAGAEIILTIKLHGTSQRSGYVLDSTFLPWYKKLFSKSQYRHMIGSKNVIINDSDSRNSYYGTDAFRYDVANRINCEKNLVYYYEIVGYIPENGKSIMPSVSTKGTKELAQYGPKMTYTYGCVPNTCDFYVYRIVDTSNNQHKELTWDELVDHCNSIGVKHVPFVDKFVYDGDKDVLFAKIDSMVNGPTGMECFPSVIDSSHIEEGLVIRWSHLGRTDFVKHKNFIFLGKEMETKSDDSVVDIEEVS